MSVITENARWMVAWTLVFIGAVAGIGIVVVVLGGGQ